ncbi:unnamed protein product [Pleuronectes platessa]|uniref:Uncharacterized protein n=1 Tax=Pleuronectes platessa TaxID=8262 RepID=A0A9N7Y3T0_PLEPL|nr:unnamed protein product [Pleuronectes platessa]
MSEEQISPGVSQSSESLVLLKREQEVGEPPVQIHSCVKWLEMEEEEEEEEEQRLGSCRLSAGGEETEKGSMVLIHPPHRVNGSVLIQAAAGEALGDVRDLMKQEIPPRASPLVRVCTVSIQEQ